MYLTRARLNPDARVQALLPLLRPHENDAARTHHLVWSLMSDGPERERDYLYRHGSDGMIYVLSERAPQASPLWVAETVEQSGWQPGDRVAFTLRCSPVVRRKGSRGQTVKRDPVLEALAKLPEGERKRRRLDVAQSVITDWLSRLGTTSGYRIEAITVNAYQQERVRTKAATISIADVSGILTITDGGAFEARRRDGFGTARAWGCGLMLCRRIGLVT